jgi:hypothetical protein
MQGSSKMPMHEAAPSLAHGKALTCGSLIALVMPHIPFCYLNRHRRRGRV